MASVFEGLEVGPAIEVFALNKAYNEDKSPLKVNLGVGGMFHENTFFNNCFRYISSVVVSFAEHSIYVWGIRFICYCSRCFSVDDFCTSVKAKRNWRQTRFIDAKRSYCTVFINKHQKIDKLRCHLKVIPNRYLSNNRVSSAIELIYYMCIAFLLEKPLQIPLVL